MAVDSFMKPAFSMLRLRMSTTFGLISTNVTFAAPRDNASRPNEPVPQKRSAMIPSSIMSYL